MIRWGLAAVVVVLLVANAAGDTKPRPFKSDRLDKKYMCSQRVAEAQELCQRFKFKATCERYQDELKDCARHL